MNGDTAISLVAQRLGNRNIFNARILSEMNLAQDMLEQHPILPWFLSQDPQELATLPSGNNSLDLPTDFLREEAEPSCWIYDSTADTPFTCVKKDTDSAARLAQGRAYTTPGKPRRYALQADKLIFFPQADANYVIWFQWFKRDSAIANTPTANLWLTNVPGLLVAETCLVMGRHLHMADRQMKEFKQDVQREQSRFITNIEARQHAGRRYQMGDE